MIRGGVQVCGRAGVWTRAGGGREGGGGGRGRGEGPKDPGARLSDDEGEAAVEEGLEAGLSAHHLCTRLLEEVHHVDELEVAALGADPAVPATLPGGAACTDHVGKEVTRHAQHANRQPVRWLGLQGVGTGG